MASPMPSRCMVSCELSRIVYGQSGSRQFKLGVTLRCRRNRRPNQVRRPFNIRSRLNKRDYVLDEICDPMLDIMCLVETWHDADSICFRRLLVDGYQVVDRPRRRSLNATASLVINYVGVASLAAPAYACPPSTTTLAL